MAKAKMPALDRIIQNRRDDLAAAIRMENWQSAVDATFDALRWRAVRLSALLGISSDALDPDLGWRPMITLLRQDSFRAFTEEASGGDGGNYKIEIIVEVLDAMIDTAAMLEAGTYKTGPGALQLTLVAANLGRCELMLGFAEEGFWEQVYEWRKRQGGKPRGTGLAPWKEQAAILIQGWVEEKPRPNVLTVQQKLHEWLCTNGYRRDFATAKTGYYEMKKAGAFKWPDKGKS